MARSYRQKLDADNTAAAAKRLASQDIAPLYPPPGDLKRRRRCERDLRFYLETYHPATFRLAWSEDHLRVIDRLQSAILNGGLFCLAMPRGSGKTSLSIRAALWALLYGHHYFVCLVGATEAAAVELLDDLKTEILWNERLGEDFRQVCYPFRHLDGNARKSIGQRFDGTRTVIGWGSRKLVFPTIPDSACDGANVSGAVVSVAGLTGKIRGQKHTLVTGEVIRPSLVLLDDPQTRESAKSVEQSSDRAAIVAGDVLGMAGPGQRITAVMPCTVIRSGDLADVMLDRKRNPQWQGVRTKALYSWPTAEKLWDRYRELRAEAMRRELLPDEAAQLYEENRHEMDSGARVAWEGIRKDGDLSALQSIMHLYFDLGEESFSAEYQNEPLVADSGPAIVLPAGEIAQKLNGLSHRTIPERAAHLTCFIDVHDSLLYWMVAAWEADFTGCVVDYGAWPEQRRRVFSLRKASPTLPDRAPGAGREGAIRAGLVSLCDMLLSRAWKREDGAELKIERGLVDSGYCPDVVFDYVRRGPHSAILYPSRGVGVKAAGKPMEEWTIKAGERAGHGWILGKPAKRTGRSVRFDANLWKSFVHARIGCALGDKGGVTLYGKSPEHHQLLSEHLAAEVPVEVSASGRTVLEWKLRVETSDNHWLDCLVGNAVAASIQGAQLAGLGPAKPQRKRKVSWAAFQAAQKKGRR